MRERSIPLCIGSDSNMRIDPLEELRELEGIARRQTGRRGIFSTDELLAIGAAEGARALQLDELGADRRSTSDHRSLAGVAPRARARGADRRLRARTSSSREER